MPFRSAEPMEPDVVAPWGLGGGRRGILWLHGFAGTPPELRGLGTILAEAGFRCVAPLLVGHGTTPAELEATTRQQWIASAQTALQELHQQCDEVFVAGQSMGGTMALHLASVDMRIKAVATLAAPIWLAGYAHHLLPVYKRVRRWHYAGDDIDLFDREAIKELHSYAVRPTKSLHEFTAFIAEVRCELAYIRAPVLILHGGGDRVVDPRNAEEIAQRLVCSAAVEREIFPRSGHGMSVDVDRLAIAARIADWFSRYSTVTSAAEASSPARDR